MIRISSYKAYPQRPDKNIVAQQDQVYQELTDGATNLDWNRLDGTLEYIDGQYDCSDFRLVNLVRILYEYGDQIPSGTLSKIEDTLLNFRYWWDEPGENFPHVAQEGNVNLSIYNTPAKKGLMEAALLDFTHAWFPKEQFDSTIVTGNYAMGKKGNTYCT